MTSEAINPDNDANLPLEATGCCSHAETPPASPSRSQVTTDGSWAWRRLHAAAGPSGGRGHKGAWSSETAPAAIG